MFGWVENTKERKWWGWYFPSKPTKMHLSELERRPGRKWDKKIQMTFLPLFPIVFSLPKLCFSFECRELPFFLTQLLIWKENSSNGKLLCSTANGELVRLVKLMTQNLWGQNILCILWIDDLIRKFIFALF